MLISWWPSFTGDQCDDEVLESLPALAGSSSHLVQEHSAFGVSVVGFLGDPPQAGDAPGLYLGDAPHIESGLRIVEDLDGTAVLSVIQGPEHALSLALKRALDIIGATLALVLLAPLLLAVALHIRVRDGSPVLLRQMRIGVHGRPFTILKLRTMASHAEQAFPGGFPPQRDPGAGVQDVGRPEGDDVGSIPAQDQHRRAAAAVECAHG